MSPNFGYFKCTHNGIVALTLSHFGYHGGIFWAYMAKSLLLFDTPAIFHLLNITLMTQRRLDI